MSAQANTLVRTKPRKPMSRTLAMASVSIVLTIVALATIYPLIFIGLVAFMTPADYLDNPLQLPPHPSLGSLLKVWGTADFGVYVLNSFLVVTCAVALLVVLATLAGFAFAHLKFPGLRASFLVSLGLMVLPPSLFMVSTFKIVVDLGLLNNYLGLILVYTSLQLPFGIFMMWTFFQAVPEELIDAAQLDGASLFRTFRSIVLPLAGPAVLTLVTLTFLTLWNDLLFSMIILQDPEKRTIIVGLSLLRGNIGINSDTVAAAGMLVSVIPPMLLFVLFNRQIVSGLTVGAGK